MGETTNPLDNLRGLHMPEPISWWPPAPGWWGLLILIIAICLAVYYWRQRPRKPKTVNIDYRKAALAELSLIEQQLEHDDDKQTFIHELTLLMKRFVRAYQPSAAAFTGEQWLNYLDNTGGNGKFQAFHHQLCIAPYAQHPVENEHELVNLVRTWIQHFPQHLDDGV